MLRRDFLRRTATGFGAALFATKFAPAASLETEPLPRKFNAHDEVVLGKTGIRTSRLAMGTGTIGFGGASEVGKSGVRLMPGVLSVFQNSSGLPLRNFTVPFASDSPMKSRVKTFGAGWSKRQ